MNNIEELKKAANAIGYEKWIDSAGEVTSVDYLAGGDITCDHICNCEEFNGESANAKFIALANPATILDLIAQLEVAQKERDALREVHIGAGSNTRAAADIYFQLVEELEVPAGGSLVGVIDNLKAELSAANEKLKPISFDELADRVQFVTGGIRMSFDPLNCKGHQIVPFMNFNSLSRIVEMYRATETYHLAGFTVEE